ncbi:tetratricopeptide repeat protein [Fulvivirga sedimenti]|uniref:Tetratricopeptide repeat protein n=1 Tax=Fulvivirga sedimenti TaxID=2879465 RepID=A0A9X1HVZ5_9BACT|nr:tetratricopeptide repeat protein [Fulvivirga sedimenti]MCA6078068.1 tetratricopeptide repeat protein [Fulvivirga sedimenti]
MKSFLIPLLLCCLSMTMEYAHGQNKKSKEVDAKTRLEAEFYFTEGEKFFILEDFAKALVLFRKSAESDPNNATAHFKMAQVYRLMGDQVQALQEISTAISINPDNKYFHALQAELYTDMNEFDRAADVYENMISSMDGTDEYLFELAAIYLFQQKYEKAITAYDRIEQYYGASEEIGTQRQMIYLQQNKLDKAIAEGEKLIESFTETDKYAVRQVELLLNNGMEKEAGVEIMELIEKFPQSARLRLILSDMQRKSGNVALAEESLREAFRNPVMDIDTKVQQLAEYRTLLSEDELRERALPLAEILTEVHPESALAYAVKGDLYQALGDRAESKNAYLKALQYDQSNLSVWQNVLQMLIENNRMDSVLLLSEEALEVFPNQGMIYYFNGAANLQKQNYDEAVYALEQGKRLSSANLGLVSVFNSMLGDAYNGAGDYTKSDRAYDAALDFDPDNLAVLNNYSYYLALRKEKLDKAEAMARRAVDGDPDNTTFLDTYAWVLFTQEKYKEASKVIEKAINLGNVSAIHYEHYGDILYKLGEINAAVEQWKKARELNPKAPLIDKKIAEKTLYE